MGSFAYTCSASNLPLEAGTPVRFFALVESRIEGDWHPLTLPIQAVYNDYGSVEDIKPGVVANEFFRILSRCAVEKGPGDNQCHDVAVRKDMPRDNWLTALWENRIQTPKKLPTSAVEALDTQMKALEGRSPPKAEPGIPTLKSVEAAISAEGLQSKDYLVDERFYGHVRVRVEGYGPDDQEKLAALQLPEYAKVLMGGTGHYPDTTELLVVPKPGNRVYQEDAPQPTRQVCQAMIREDVWKLLLEGLDSFKRLADQAHKPLSEREPPNRYFEHQDLLPFAVWDTTLRDPGFLEDLIQTATVNRNLSDLRCVWAPGSKYGPQFGLFGAHSEFHKALATIAGLEKMTYPG